MCVAFGILLSGCPDAPFNPCPENEGPVADVGQMDTRWQLDEVNGDFLPLVNPEAPGEILTSLRMDFRTTAAEKGSKCSDVRKTTGSVIATVVSTKDQQLKVGRYSGSFSRDHESNETTITAVGYELPLIRSGAVFTASTQSVSGNKKPDAFIFRDGYTLRFSRILGP